MEKKKHFCVYIINKYCRRQTEIKTGEILFKFKVHSTDWVKQSTTFAKFKLLQDQTFKIIQL